MMRRMITLVTTGLMAVATTSPALASSQSGTITKVAQTANRVFFELSGSRSTMPGCSCCNRWEIIASSASDQAMIAIILTAFAQNKAVQVSGLGTCVAGANDTEGIAYVNADF